MSWEALVSSGAVAWAILAILVIEALILARVMRGHAYLPAVLAGLAAGAGLVLALRAALSGGDVLEIALFLAMSGIAHALEIRFWLAARNRK